MAKGTSETATKYARKRAEGQKQCSIWLDQDMYAWLKAYAKQNNRTTVGQIRHMLQNERERQERRDTYR